MENNENMLNEMARMRELIKFDYSLNEQRRRPKVTISWGEPKSHFKRFQKDSQSDTVSFNEYETKIPEEQWNEYLKNDKKMVNLMQGGSKRFWAKLKSDVIHKGYAVAALEKFNETYQEKKWESVFVTDTTITTKIDDKTDDDTLPGVPFKFPANMEPNSKFFVDNYYELTDVFIQSVKSDIIDPISKQMADITNVPEGEPKAFIDAMSVKSSCSTLPNGESPDGEVYSFEDLSRLRNQTATDYVLAELRKIGVFIPDSFTPSQNWMGTNPDKPGTSGPAWDSKWDEKIKAQKRPEYEKYKYLDMELMVGFNIKDDPIPVPGDEDSLLIKSDIYSIKFKTPGRKFIFRTPKIAFNWVYKQRRKPKDYSKVHKLKCSFKTSKKHWWNDPKLGH